jgi:hypothetical protein
VPRVANVSGARGHRTREPCWGDGGAASCERRGAPARIAPSGRGRRSLQARCAGAHKPAASHRGTGKTKPSRSEKEKWRGAEPQTKKLVIGSGLAPDVGWCHGPWDI